MHTYFDNLASNSNCSTWDFRVSGMTKRSDTEAIEGRLELCYNKNWFSVNYNNRYYGLNPNVVCQRLGYEINTGKKCYDNSLCIVIIDFILICLDSTLYSIQRFYHTKEPSLSLFPLHIYCLGDYRQVSGCRVLTTSIFSNYHSYYEMGVRCLPGMVLFKTDNSMQYHYNKQLFCHLWLTLSIQYFTSNKNIRNVFG